MAVQLVYPATETQANTIINKVDAIDAKITTPRYQVKTVTPSNIQKTVQADPEFTALSGVVVNPIAALMPNNLVDYIMRNDQMENFSISVNGAIPDYACYGQKKMAAVYGELSGSVGEYAFYNCTKLQNIDARNVTLIGMAAFRSCVSLQNVDARNVTSIDSYAFINCTNLQLIDCTSCTAPPTIQANTFGNTNNSFRVAVAIDTEKALFQAATNWSAIANQIYTVAEIEALVGMTYDEYYLQCFGHARFD